MVCFTDHLGKVGAIRKQNPSVKVMLAVGGWNAGSGPFSNMAATASSRKVFIDSVIALLDKYTYDGLDLDWEYPAQREGSKPQDKQNFSLLIKVSKCKNRKNKASRTHESCHFKHFQHITILHPSKHYKN